MFGLGYFWLRVKLRKVSPKNAITVGNSWIPKNSISERKEKVFLIQIHDLSLGHFFNKKESNYKIAIVQKGQRISSITIFTDLNILSVDRGATMLQHSTNWNMKHNWIIETLTHWTYCRVHNQ